MADIYLGFMLLNNLNSDFIHNIVTERELNGDYTSVENFINRIQTGLESIQTLIFIGAFRSTGKSKSQLIIEARMLLVNHKSTSNNYFSRTFTRI
jgi:DNA polymerase III alpha subunit